MTIFDGLEQLERVECYLFAGTHGKPSYDYNAAHIFWQAVNIIRSAQHEAREVIANRIGAVLR